MFRNLAVAVALLASGPALAGEQDFTLVNKTGYSIDSVYVDSSSSDEWGDDIMGQDVLENGASVDIEFDGYGGECKYDMLAIYSDGSKVTWKGLNLCKINTVKLFWDAKTDVTRAVVE